VLLVPEDRSVLGRTSSTSAPLRLSCLPAFVALGRIRLVLADDVSGK
jgi:hypothetical protein